MEKINTTVNAKEYKNVDMMFAEYLKKFEETPEKLRELLQSDNLAEFELACNYLYSMDYSKENDMMSLEMKNIKFEEKAKLREIANANVRKHFGLEFSELFDRIVKESKQELWGGDELFKLYTGMYPPYYVASCIKSALSVKALMTIGITNFDQLLMASSCIKSALYWTVYDKSKEENDSVASTKDHVVWQKIRAYLFEGKRKDAFNYMQAIGKKTDNRFGNGFSSISLEYVDEEM